MHLKGYNPGCADPHLLLIILQGLGCKHSYKLFDQASLVVTLFSHKELTILGGL